MGDVRQEDGQLGHVELPVVDENKEENETDEGRDQDEETEEKSLAGPDTVHPGVGHHLPGGHGQSVQLIVSPEPAKVTISLRPFGLQFTVKSQTKHCAVINKSRMRLENQIKTLSKGLKLDNGILRRERIEYMPSIEKFDESPHLGFLPILSHMTRSMAAMMRLNSMTKG